MYERNNKPQHVVYRYNYTMEQSREYMLDTSKRERTMAFEKIFDVCQDRIHAIFLFLTVLELVQMQHLKILIGEGTNNFIIEYNEEQDTQPAS
jgi:segregation and condensation protein A